MDTNRPGWCPPFCPNYKCKYHKDSTGMWCYKRKGFFLRRARPHRVQRFTCLACNRHFSSQTFSTTYWQKCPRLTGEILLLVVGGMANRQISRAIKCTPSTVQHHISRLARHCMLFHAIQKQPASCEIVIDGFETFEHSQYNPFHHNLAVDVKTGYFLYHTDSPLRRKGRMTPAQKESREARERQLGRPDPKAVRKGITELLAVVTRGLKEITVRSDDHRAYPPAMRQVECRITHHVTSSKVHRNVHNALFEINLLDMFIRHSITAHHRETIAFPKRRQASAEKLTIFQVWKNHMKRRWEKGPPVSPAMLMGIADRLLATGELLSGRLFRTRIDLPPAWDAYYDRRVITPALGTNRTHRLKYAY